MPLLLIEDDVAECMRYKEVSMRRDDVRFVEMTGSSREGIKSVKEYMPEGVIFDIELHKGEGSGPEFLDGLREISLPFMPILIVITNNTSTLIYDRLREQGADFIFYKKQNGYCAERVVDCAVSLRKVLKASPRDGMPREIQTIETPDTLKRRIMDKIEAEMSLVGVGIHLKGWKYLCDAIYILITKPANDDESIFVKLGRDYRLSTSSITRTMQNAINNAWRASSVEDLQLHYKARIDYRVGVPLPMEFVYYYADKIKKLL